MSLIVSSQRHVLYLTPIVPRCGIACVSRHTVRRCVQNLVAILCVHSRVLTLHFCTTPHYFEIDTAPHTSLRRSFFFVRSRFLACIIVSAVPDDASASGAATLTSVAFTPEGVVDPPECNTGWPIKYKLFWEDHFNGTELGETMDSCNLRSGFGSTRPTLDSFDFHPTNDLCDLLCSVLYNWFGQSVSQSSNR